MTDYITLREMTGQTPQETQYELDLKEWNQLIDDDFEELPEEEWGEER